MIDLNLPAGRAVDGHGSTGVTAQALVRSDGTAVTVLRIAANGEVGRHPARVDQLLLVLSGRGAAQAGDGHWQEIHPGQAVVWRAGEEHTTRAVEAMTALVLEMSAGL